MTTTNCPRCQSSNLACNGNGMSISYRICRDCLAGFGLEKDGAVHAGIVLTATAGELSEAELTFAANSRGAVVELQPAIW